MPRADAQVHLLDDDDDVRYHRLWMLLDVGLPDADGVELAREPRRDHPALRVVLHGGAALADGRRRAIEAGAVDLLEKPLPVAYLIALLAR